MMNNLSISISHILIVILLLILIVAIVSFGLYFIIKKAVKKGTSETINNQNKKQ